jgi:hypothetical protein
MSSGAKLLEQYNDLISLYEEHTAGTLELQASALEELDAFAERNSFDEEAKRRAEMWLRDIGK